MPRTPPLRFNTGNGVRHPVHGEGTIVASVWSSAAPSARRYMVRFAEGAEVVDEDTLTSVPAAGEYFASNWRKPRYHKEGYRPKKRRSR